MSHVYTICNRVGEQYGGSTCFPYRVDHVPQVGRILTAARDIQPGEVVFQEQEMVVGPCRTNVPLCLGIYKRFLLLSTVLIEVYLNFIEYSKPMVH